MLYNRSMTALPHDIDDGRAHHEAGRLDAAEAVYRGVLERDPENAEAMHLMGVLAYQQGRLDAAIDWFGRAVARDGANPKYLGNLGTAYVSARRHGEALAVLERAAATGSAGAGVLNSLGEAYRGGGRLDEAIEAFRGAIAAEPGYAEARANLAVALMQAGRLDEALGAAEDAVLGATDNAANHNVLGSVLFAAGRIEAARTAFEDALALAPGFAEARRNLALALVELHRYEAAIVQYRALVDAHPGDGAGYAGLAQAARLQGRLEDALAMHRKAVECDPRNPVYHASLLFDLLGDPATDARAALAEHRAWSARHAAALAPASPAFGNTREAGRRLRLGYVSGDLRGHPVGRLALPAIAGHDADAFEVICYSQRRDGDRLTEALRAASDGWRVTATLGDAALADAVRADGIDILVDLSGHTARGRLLAFARRPAPVQIGWLGYLSTTGLDAIDYVIGDPVHTPAGCEDEFCEAILRLPHDLACFDPPDDAPAPGAVPSAEGAPVTFGVFNNPGKITAPCAALWARLLDAVPGARILFRYRAYDDAGARAAVTARFALHGIDGGRLAFEGGSDYRGVLEAYDRVDIALDTFPYAGTMTTFEALWMGVPVVTLSGERMVARAGASHLAAAGLDRLVAADADGYLAIARELAGDTAGLAGLRATMRARLAVSPLCDTASFVRDLEALYREAWRRWCEAGG